MRSRMSAAASGWLVRSSDSVQPVHSWKWSQTTDGFCPFATFSAIFSPAHAGSPTAAAAAEQTFTKSRRESPVSEIGIRRLLVRANGLPVRARHHGARQVRPVLDAGQ